MYSRIANSIYNSAVEIFESFEVCPEITIHEFIYEGNAKSEKFFIGINFSECEGDFLEKCSIKVHVFLEKDGDFHVIKLLPTVLINKELSNTDALSISLEFGKHDEAPEQKSGPFVSGEYTSKLLYTTKEQ